MTYIEVGWIQNTHGIKGELKVRSSSDFPEVHFKKGKKLFLHQGEIELEISQVRQQKDLYLLQFKGYENINLVEAWKNEVLWISCDQQVALAKGEYYRYQLIGLEVYDDQEELVGTIVSIEETNGAQNNLRIQTKEKEVLFPFIPSFIEKVDLPQKFIKVKGWKQFL